MLRPTTFHQRLQIVHVTDGRIRENGGTPNGEPGERPMYGKGYYAAFVLDPLGNNIEVAKRG